MEYTRKIGPMPGQPGAGSGQPDRTMSFATVTSDSADPPNVRTLDPTTVLMETQSATWPRQPGHFSATWLHTSAIL